MMNKKFDRSMHRIFAKEILFCRKLLSKYRILMLDVELYNEKERKEIHRSRLINAYDPISVKVVSTIPVKVMPSYYHSFFQQVFSHLTISSYQQVSPHR